jgi:hypothetical protein
MVPLLAFIDRSRQNPERIGKTQSDGVQASKPPHRAKECWCKGMLWCKGTKEAAIRSMRNHPGKASVAQSLDGESSDGEPAFPLLII